MSHTAGGGGGGALIGLVFFLIVIGISLFFMLVWAAVGYWAYKDAGRRQMDNPLLWGLIVFLTGLIGLVVYFLIREEPPSTAAADGGRPAAVDADPPRKGGPPD